MKGKEKEEKRMMEEDEKGRCRKNERRWKRKGGRKGLMELKERRRQKMKGGRNEGLKRMKKERR